MIGEKVTGPPGRVRWLLANFEEVATALLLAVMIGSIGLSVFSRYALHAPLSWTEEVVLICMVWTCFLGASLATKHGEHIVVDFVVTIAPPRLSRGLELISLVIVTLVLAMLVWQGVLLVDRTREVTTIALGIPTMYLYAAVPVSAALMLIHNLRHLVGAFRRPV